MQKLLLYSSNFSGHTRCTTANVSSPPVSRSDPPSVLHGNTHGSVSIIVRVCMMPVNLFGWGCHVKLLEVTYTHTHAYTDAPVDLMQSARHKY